MGIAWIDANGGGAADEALGFHITFGPRGVPVLGAVDPVEPSHAVVAVR